MHTDTTSVPLIRTIKLCYSITQLTKNHGKNSGIACMVVRFLHERLRLLGPSPKRCTTFRFEFASYRLAWSSIMVLHLKPAPHACAENARASSVLKAVVRAYGRNRRAIFCYMLYSRFSETCTGDMHCVRTQRISASLNRRIGGQESLLFGVK